MGSAPTITAHPGAWPQAYFGQRRTPPPSLSEGRPYGSGKAVLASVLRDLNLPDGATVLLPALVPPRLPEAIRAAGASAEFYRVTPDLGPDVDDLRDRTDGAAVLVGVQYFGFPQSAFGTLRDVADEADLVLVDDSSHAPLSERDGRPLGSFGDVGFTSLHKLLPVPDGALRYGDGREERATPSVAASYAAADVRFVVGAAARAVGERWPLAGRLLGSSRAAIGLVRDALRDREAVEAGPDWARPTSRLTLAFLAGMDRERIVSRRRARYREWLAVVDCAEGVDPVYDSLPPGVCPWKFPVVCADPTGFRSTLRGAVAGAITWPTLPPGVTPREYPTATRLSRTLVLLPVHQGIPSGRIRGLRNRFERSG